MISEEIIKDILKEIGDDPSRSGLKDTPARVQRMYEEMFKGYNDCYKPNLTIFPNKEDGVNYDQIIADEGYFFSHCEHHMIPFFGQYYFGYIPDKKVIGLSKIARLIDFHASRLQVQERLGEQVAQDIQEILEPKGVILILKARHLCKEARGVKKINSRMTTSVVKGVFADDASAKQEFFNLIN